MEAMQVYHLTIQENGHSRRFVYEDRDEALTRFADAIAAGLEAKLDEVVRPPAPRRRSGRRTSQAGAESSRRSAAAARRASGEAPARGVPRGARPVRHQDDAHGSSDRDGGG